MGNYKYLIISAFALAGRMGAIEHKSRGAAALYPGLCACCLFKAHPFYILGRLCSLVLLTNLPLLSKLFTLIS